MWLGRVQILVATLWAGSLWAIGYLAAPTLFATLADRALAGTIAGSLFRVQSWVSLVCGTLLIFLVLTSSRKEARRRKQLVILIVGMLACAAIMQFGLHPMIAALREVGAAAGGEAAAELKSRFGMLHGISSGIFLLESLLAVVLVWKIR